jgi:hypothetical protein
MTWERSLLSKGNGNGNGNTGVNHCLFFYYLLCALFFSSLCVFFLFLILFLAWHGIYLCHSVVSSIYLIPRCHAYRTWVLFLTLLDRYTDFTCNGKCC